MLVAAKLDLERKVGVLQELREHLRDASHPRDNHLNSIDQRLTLQGAQEVQPIRYRLLTSMPLCLC